MILNKNNMPLYATGTKYSDSTLKSMTKDKLLEYLDIAQHNYECANESLYNIRQYAEKLDKALDKACDLLEKSKAGTTCDEENRKNCMENHCFNTCIYARKMNKEEWRDYLMKGDVEWKDQKTKLYM